MTTRIAAEHDLSLGMFEDESRHNIMRSKPASDASVETILKADPTSMDGRSNWLWFRLPNDDLIFGCFPEGATYFATEYDHSF
ncbi:hypothetical protein [Mesorhizobium sp. B2-4-1]|uniref:hypothetical protein n=1 Tax=Mesorhizobium sp. B2-4-1 TaxID=2589948 RepID=UPI0011282D5B|nr:hypothetical protein [Mesorhizobium sp. B2-4-1]TPL66591.1 hypothetical protein FJ949_09500 [Mesorhizobium sp. B2-4-1]